MFICEKCLLKFRLYIHPDLCLRNYGNCENCRRISLVYDIPHKMYMQKSLIKRDNPSRRDSK